MHKFHTNLAPPLPLSLSLSSTRPLPPLLPFLPHFPSTFSFHFFSTTSSAHLLYQHPLFSSSTSFLQLSPSISSPPLTLVPLHLLQLSFFVTVSNCSSLVIQYRHFKTHHHTYSFFLLLSLLYSLPVFFSSRFSIQPHISTFCPSHHLMPKLHPHQQHTTTSTHHLVWIPTFHLYSNKHVYHHHHPHLYPH